jgi:hypothetical protein
VDYPLDGFIEIAELSLQALPVRDTKPEVAGVGIERVRLARGERVLTFEQSRRALLKDLEAEAGSRGIGLPPAHAVMSSA